MIFKAVASLDEDVMPQLKCLRCEFEYKKTDNR